MFGQNNRHPDADLRRVHQQPAYLPGTHARAQQYNQEAEISRLNARIRDLEAELTQLKRKPK